MEYSFRFGTDGSWHEGGATREAALKAALQVNPDASIISTAEATREGLGDFIPQPDELVEMLTERGAVVPDTIKNSPEAYGLYSRLADVADEWAAEHGITQPGRVYVNVEFHTLTRQQREEILQAA